MGACFGVGAYFTLLDLSIAFGYAPQNPPAAGLGLVLIALGFVMRRLDKLERQHLKGERDHE